MDKMDFIYSSKTRHYKSRDFHFFEDTDFDDSEDLRKEDILSDSD